MKREVVLSLDGRHTFLPEFLRFVASQADAFNAALASELAEQIEAQLDDAKPDEPQGLGAVVEDASEAMWIRWSRGDGAVWRCPDRPGFVAASWDRVHAVRVLSEGVPHE